MFADKLTAASTPPGTPPTQSVWFGASHIARGDLARDFAKLLQVAVVRSCVVPPVLRDTYVAGLFKICEGCTRYFFREVGSGKRLCLICAAMKTLQVPESLRLFAEGCPRLRRSL